MIPEDSVVWEKPVEESTAIKKAMQAASFILEMFGYDEYIFALSNMKKNVILKYKLTDHSINLFIC